MKSKWPLPKLNALNADFWTGGRAAELRIPWCDGCGAWRHPSLEVCPGCLQALTVRRTVSGRAVILAHTASHLFQAKGLPPDLIAIVGLEEDISVRLTTNIVNVAPGDVTVGLPVRVVFEAQEDLWLPKFEPDPDRTAPSISLNAPTPAIPRARAREKFETKIAITGIGSSQIGRQLAQTDLALTLEACAAAIDDAGLRPADIDGLCAYPGSDGLPGLSQGGVRAVEQVLRLSPAWHCGAHEIPGQIGAVIEAMLAVAAGLCRHVLCFTSFAASKRPGFHRTEHIDRIAGEPSWSLPFGCATPANWLALYASQYCARYGIDPDFFGLIAINARKHAARNPAALYREPLDMQSYRSARLISTPFRLFDCDVPCDGAMAVIISDARAANDLRRLPVHVEAVGTQMAELQSWDQGTLTHQPQVFGAAAHLWSRTELRQRDVDVALLYDGFTFNVISWLEALGFCGVGEAKHYLGDGRRIAPGGDLPLNPHGGHLAAGRTNGYGGLLEAVVQLRGDALARQVHGAKIALVTAGGAIPAGCILLRAP
jgi:acetyl-CoA acetyltransferase/uncharacterized OB-fold protein